MPTTTAPTIEQLKRAITVAEQIEKLQSELNQILGGGGANASTSTAVKDPRKGKRSAAVRARMAAAQQARWAKSKGETSAPTTQKKKGKRTMSPEARAKIAAAQRARWAKSKGAKVPTAAVIGKIAKIEAAAPKARKKQKRNISPEAKARMVEAVKRRWAKQKAAKAPTAKAKAKIAQAGQPQFKVL